MASYLKIKNKGLVEVEAFSLVGASTKRNDSNKIGMFGSGNKYAIAYLMRNGYDVQIYSGSKEIVLSTVKKQFSNQAFDVITINGESTSITTEMGIKWTLWQSIRELYSNALDEGLLEFDIVDRVDNEDSGNNTSIYVSVNYDLQHLYNNIGDYFAIDKKVLFENKYGKIYQKQSPSTNIYRKGIRVYDTKEESLFDYDLHNVSINESRIVEYHWDMMQQVAKLIYSCDNEYVIQTILQKSGSGDYFENRISDSIVSTYATELNEKWKEVLQDKKIAPSNLAGWLDKEELLKTNIVNSRLYNDIISRFGDSFKSDSFRASSRGVPYKTTTINALQSDTLQSVLNFFKDVNFEIPYAVDVVKFMDSNTHGTIDSNSETILIGVNALDNGKQWVANVIIEELIHLKYDAPDETRKFQDSVINEFINYMKETNTFNL